MTLNDREFIPDDVRIQPHSDGERVKVTFLRDTNESREVVLRRSWLPQFLNAMRNEIAPGQAVPIDPNSLSFGRSYSLQGWECKRSPEGGARMTLYIDLPDQGRVVTMPISLGPDEVTHLIDQLRS